MTDKREEELDAALAALARAERAAWPEVSGHLHARVLADAAEVAGEVAATRSAATPARRVHRSPGRRGWLGRLRELDLWAGAAIAAAIICLVVGLGVGYEVGDRVLAQAGFEDVRVAQVAEDEALLFAEDAL